MEITAKLAHTRRNLEGGRTQGVKNIGKGNPASKVGGKRGGKKEGSAEFHKLRERDPKRNGRERVSGGRV